MMSKKDLIHQIMKSIDHYVQERIKKYRVNERGTRRKDYDRICCFKTKKLFLFNIRL